MTCILMQQVPVCHDKAIVFRYDVIMQQGTPSKSWNRTPVLLSISMMIQKLFIIFDNRFTKQKESFRILLGKFSIIDSSNYWFFRYLVKKGCPKFPGLTHHAFSDTYTQHLWLRPLTCSQTGSRTLGSHVHTKLTHQWWNILHKCGRRN